MLRVARPLAMSVLLSRACGCHEDAPVPDSRECEAAAWHFSYAADRDALDYSNEPDIFQVMADVDSSLTLLSANEAPLQPTTAPGDVTMRLTWKPSFNAPVVVRVDMSDGAVSMSATELIWDATRENYRPNLRTEGELPTESWAQIADWIDKSDFWTLPCFKRDEAVIDGALMFLEMADNHGQHCVARFHVWEYPLIQDSVSCLLSWSTPAYDDAELAKGCPEPPTRRVCIAE